MRCNLHIFQQTVGVQLPLCLSPDNVHHWRYRGGEKPLLSPSKWLHLVVIVRYSPHLYPSLFLTH